MKLEDLSIGYAGHAVQQDLHLTIEHGEMICLLGPNGSGKSTLLRTLAGLLPALQGHCWDEGADLLSMSENERAKRCAVVLTDRLTAEHTTVRDVVAMGRLPYSTWTGRMSEHDEAIIAEAMAKTQVTALQERYFTTLSDGEKQRVLIAKAIAQDTPYIFLDEPTAHLDLPNRITCLQLLRDLAHQTHRAIIISTHELDLALRFADRIWLMAAHQGGVEANEPKKLVENRSFQRVFGDIIDLPNIQ